MVVSISVTDDRRLRRRRRTTPTTRTTTTGIYDNVIYDDTVIIQDTGRQQMSVWAKVRSDRPREHARKADAIKHKHAGDGDSCGIPWQHEQTPL